MDYSRILKILYLLLSLLVACGQSEVKKMETIVLDGIRRYDNDLIRYDTNDKTIFAVVRSERNDTIEYELFDISSLSEVKQYKLNYLYLGYKSLIFSNHPFIHPASDKQFEYIIRKNFPKQYKLWKYQNTVCPVRFDGTHRFLSFYKGIVVRHNN
jgi:hypothetical protein